MFATSDRFKLTCSTVNYSIFHELNRHKNTPRRNKSDKLFQSSSSQRGIPFIYMHRGRQWLTQMADKWNESSGPDGHIMEAFLGVSCYHSYPADDSQACYPRWGRLYWVAPPLHPPAAAGKAGRPMEAQHFGVCLSSQRNPGPGEEIWWWRHRNVVKSYL